MQTFDYNFILLYKQQGEQPNEDCKLLNDQDLLLVIETEFQKDMLLKHGAMVVCMDTTYNVNNYNFHLIPSYQEGIPVAYANFNWEDKVAIIATGVHIKLKCKRFKSCLLFMSCN